eukprot:CAMPEP_0176132024 /NCGR_PEP_ID=MMETSP0120_2-20121206/66855_1 /TAXON_ID=160619 /ORGANISM="Kryptoperidinium foliaceum, Strain CCMP 1326" /LENGTH=47 /DNA_ID= /DNA_START= /DNA_END= /DNA_ORIENTATION=
MTVRVRDESGGEDDVSDRGTCCSNGLVAPVSSFSIQYNYGAASIAVA